MDRDLTRPLAGIKVIDLSRLAPGPYGTMLLADLGADVVAVGGLGHAVTELSRGKRFISLDLKSTAGKRALLALVRDADVFVEGFRPGVTERLGIGYATLAALNARLVYCSITGYGQNGPRALEAGHDINYLAVSGVLGIVGPPDRPPGAPLNLLADLAAGGLLASFGIATALFEREKTGRGRYIDTAMVDGCFSMLAMHLPFWNTKIMPGRGVGMVAGSAPFYRTYPCADGRYVAVGALEPKFFANLCAGLGFDDVPDQFDTAGWPALGDRIAARFARRTRDEWIAHLGPHECCASPVLDPAEAAVDAQLASRHRSVLPAGPVVPTFAGMTAEVRATDMTDRTHEVLSEVGLETDEIAAAMPRHDRSGEGFVWPPELH